MTQRKNSYKDPVRTSVRLNRGVGDLLFTNSRRPKSWGGWRVNKPNPSFTARFPLPSPTKTGSFKVKPYKKSSKGRGLAKNFIVTVENSSDKTSSNPSYRPPDKGVGPKRWTGRGKGVECRQRQIGPRLDRGTEAVESSAVADEKRVKHPQGRSLTNL